MCLHAQSGVFVVAKCHVTGMYSCYEDCVAKASGRPRDGTTHTIISMTWELRWLANCKDENKGVRGQDILCSYAYFLLDTVVEVSDILAVLNTAGVIFHMVMVIHETVAPTGILSCRRS